MFSKMTILTFLPTVTMPFTPEVNVVKICTDGFCLYRAIACQGTNQLMICSRQINGTPVDKDMQLLET